ncbi:ATP-grasp domain-containing protein [Jatrophihabitans sp.]|uniref:ATP-grasp domain-containing protein n=1 Tax=Jatrophihabitans sp. TaxID=1932789 RepID=UPI002B5443C3|nr:ATP-grasp domain-containing protein [Jatrophihabitans sp.]
MPSGRSQRLLFVYVKGGPTLEFAVPSMARVAEVHVLGLGPFPPHAEHVWRPSAASVRQERAFGREEVVNTILTVAKELRVDGILALSEFALLAVSEAAAILGLPGAGPNVVRSRDKRLMRQVWRQAGVPSPEFRPVSSLQEAHEAVAALRLPVLLKAAWSAGSVAQTVIRDESEVAAAWAAATRALDDTFESRYTELAVAGTPRDLLVEEIIDGSTDGWYPTGSGYGDYLSVEGMVDGGEYHPLCITSRIPTIPPFTELANLLPCTLDEDKQREIEQVARAAVEALGLDTCCTHTEIKLKADGTVALIESAARVGGVNVAQQMTRVFGLNPVEMLSKVLVGQQVQYPPRMLVDGQGAAGTVAIIATDSAGRRWADRDRIWDSRSVSWDSLLSPGTEAEVVTGLSVPDGTPMPRYGSAHGAVDYAGLFFLTARDAPTLLHDTYAILDGLEQALQS